MRYLLTISLLLFTLLGFSQPFNVFPLRHTNGLTNDHILNMATDKRGFLWVATEEGLNRFDGSRFIHYFKRNGLTGNELNCVLDDPTEDIMWIGTQRDGLGYYNYSTEKFGSFRHNDKDKNSLATNDITSLAPSADGKGIWATTFWRGVELLVKKDRRFVHFNTKTVRGMKTNATWCAFDAGGGMLYVGNDKAGLSIIDVHARIARNYVHNDKNPGSISGNDVHCIMRDRQGRVWVGTDKGLDLFDPVRGTFTHYNDNGRLSGMVFTIHQRYDGRLLVGTEKQGIVIIDTGTPLYGNLTQPKYTYVGEGNAPLGLSGNSVRSIVEDKFNNVWVGLYGSGIDFISTHRKLFYSLDYSPINPMLHLSNRSVLSISYDSHGNMWAGTDGDGVNVFDKSLKRVPSMESLKGKSIQAFMPESDGSMWIGSYYDNLYKWRNGSLKPVLKNGTDVRCMTVDGNNLIVGTSDGIYVVNKATETVVSHHSLPENLIRSIQKDDKGNYWIGTFGGGLMICNRQFKVLKRYTKVDGFISNTINDILVTSSGIWVGTGEGLVRFSSIMSYKVYGPKQNSDLLSVNSLYQDKEGNLWVAYNGTISCLKHGTNRLIKYHYKGRSEYGNYSTNAVAMAPNGMLVFGRTRGLTYFDPKFALDPHPVPKPIISSVVLNGINDNRGDATIVLLDKKELKLRHDENTFTVHFSCADYFYNNVVEYSYRLKGSNSSWMSTNHNEVTFSNVPFGEYELEVRCRVLNEEWTNDYTTMPINIMPPFYLTWWAKLIQLFIFFAVVAFFFFEYRNHMRLVYQIRNERHQYAQKLELNNERMGFFTGITHELRTPLTLILGPLEDISHSPNIPEKEKHRLAVIYRSAMHLKELIDRILDFRKTETGNRRLAVVKTNIVNTVREVTLKYEELGNNDNLNIRLFTSQPEIIVWHDPEVIHIIIDNLISNAMKYTRKGGIDVTVEPKTDNGHNYVDIAVSDTGYGISKEALPHIFDRYYQENGGHQASGTGIGLALVKNLVDLHNATIRVESKEGQGSSFIVRLDADTDYPNALRGVVKKEEDENVAIEDKKEEVEEKTETKRRLILIVEDNRDIREYIANAVSEDFNVKTASNGKQGLDIAIESIPDIIVSDIMMPEMDGNEMCRRLKRDMRTSHIPIILLTAKVSNRDKEQGYDAGADSYLTKPFSMTLLKSRIDNLLTQRQRLLEKMNAMGNSNNEMDMKKKMLEKNINKADKSFFDKLNELLDKNIGGDVEIDFLTKELGMSTSSLYRKMKQITGMGTNEYVRRYKIHYAEKLLLENKYTINEIAFMVGFNSTAYFRRCFKEEFGDIPSVYLKKLKNK